MFILKKDKLSKTLFIIYMYIFLYILDVTKTSHQPNILRNTPWNEKLKNTYSMFFKKLPVDTNLITLLPPRGVCRWGSILKFQMGIYVLLHISGKVFLR